MMRGIRKSLKGEKGERRASSNSSGNHSRMSSMNGSSSSFTASLVASSSASISAHSINKETPKKIIKAVSDYTAQSPTEISFQAGDFYWVIGRENDTDFYEACNPLTSVKGLVPVNLFEVLNQRKRPDSYSTKSNNSFIISNLHLSNSPGTLSSERFSNSSGRPSLSNANSSSTIHNVGANVSSGASNTGVLYGVVMYDFEARPDSDELDVSKGEYLILCAHHDYEWFIAKPINRLGGPGLVPVAYVKTLNLATKKVSGGDITDEITESGLPTVAEWKNRTAKYKATLISLSEDDSHYNNQGGMASAGSNYNGNNSYNQGNNGGAHNSFPGKAFNQKTLYEYDDQSLSNGLDDNHSSFLADQPQTSYSIFTSSPYDTDVCSLFDNGVYVTEVKIANFYYNKLSMVDERHGRYWYHIVAKLSNNKVRSLARYYDDFYELHMQLKKTFPVEAGKGNNDKERILPFFPAPHPNVTASMAHTRSQQLNEYLMSLTAIPEHISRSKSVLMLFTLRDNVDKEFTEDSDNIELPNVVGYNENGIDKVRLEQQPSSANLKEMSSVSTVTSGSSVPGSVSAVAAAATGNVPAPPSLNSNSARSSADTKGSQLSYQMGQLNLKTDSISTNATSASEAVFNDPVAAAAAAAAGESINAIPVPAKDSQKPALKITTTSQSMPSNVQYISSPAAVSAPNLAAAAVVPPPPPIKNVKIKFYYEDDIFAISVPGNTTLLDLKMKIANRIHHKLDKIRLFIKSKNTLDFNDDDLSKEIDRDEYLRQIMKKDPKLKLIIIADETSSDDEEDEEANPDKI